MGPKSAFYGWYGHKTVLARCKDNLITTNDDGGNKHDARIYYTVPSNGNYKVIATNYGKLKPALGL
jgi:hypothetical protein